MKILSWNFACNILLAVSIYFLIPLNKKLEFFAWAFLSILKKSMVNFTCKVIKNHFESVPSSCSKTVTYKVFFFGLKKNEYNAYYIRLWIKFFFYYQNKGKQFILKIISSKKLTKYEFFRSFSLQSSVVILLNLTKGRRWITLFQKS